MATSSGGLKVQQNLPPPQAPFVDPAPSGSPGAAQNLSYTGYQFLLSLLQAAANTIPTATVASGLVATGATQATALALSGEWNVFATVAAGTGALLQALSIGQIQAVYNGGSNNLSVYPPPGMSIDANAVNVAYSLAPNKWQFFRFVSATQILSTQLG